MNVAVDSSTVPSVTRMLAEFAVNLKYEDLPADIIENAKRCILDSLGCGLFGAKTPWTEAVSRVVAKLEQQPRASAWGIRQKADELGTVFINGTSAQGYEIDDVHDQSMSHYGAGVIPTVIAAAERYGLSGKEMILATVVGYELGTRIGNTVSPSAFHRGFHPCGLTSTFAAAAAMGKILKLDVDQYVSCLGLAGSQAAGLMAAQFGAMAKRFHSGKAAQNGIIAAMSAKEGLTGVRDVLEAPYGGFCSTYSDKYDLSWATNGLGKDYEMRKNGFKRYSALASSHSTIDALRAIREKHNVKADDVTKVFVETTEVVHRHCAWPYVYNGETIAAQMNLFYTGAVTLIFGNAFIDEYQDKYLGDPKIIALANKFDAVIDPEINALGPDEMRYVRVTVTVKSGEKFTETVPYRSGHWKNPIPDEALRAKFRDLAGRVLRPEAVKKIEAIVTGLETQAKPGPDLGVALQDLKN